MLTRRWPGARCSAATAAGSAVGLEHTGALRGQYLLLSPLSSPIHPSVHPALLQAWRVYQRGLERWLADLLQPLFDSLVEDKMVPSFVQVGASGCSRPPGGACGR